MRFSTASALLAALLLLSPSARAEQDAQRSSSAVYLLGTGGGQWLSSDDANRYFNSPGHFGSQVLPAWSARLGFQFARWFSIEADAQFGPQRDYDITYNNGLFNTRRIVTRWTLNSYSLIPAISFSKANMAGACVSSLGLRVGQANLRGHVDDEAFGVSGAYDSEAQAFDYGVVLRFSQIFVEHLSIGLELGYDWTRFTDISNKNGSGSYGSPHSPERDVSGIGHGGAQTTLDFSGPRLSLVIGLWSNPPAREGAQALE
jgi:hypothetical protein